MKTDPNRRLIRFHPFLSVAEPLFSGLLQCGSWAPAPHPVQYV